MSVTREQLDAYGLFNMRHAAEPAERVLVGLHFQLHSYVCGGGCTHPSPFDGWATFTQIFQQRPNKCRFAIAQMVPLKQQFGSVKYTGPEGAYLCWDLFDDALVTGQRALNRAMNDGLLAPPPPKWQGDNADALIMKAIALMTESNGFPDVEKPTPTEKWMQGLGVPMIEVFFIANDGAMVMENHVNDPLTLAETVAMSLGRTGARWAVYPDGEQWALTGRGRTRHYPTRAAAEMVAIHRGK